MFKKLFITSVAASLLFSLPIAADHHHHDKDKVKEKVAEKLAEVKAQEKSGGQKVAGGLLQFINKTAPLWALIAGAAVSYYGPLVTKVDQNNYNYDSNLKIAKGIEGVITTVILWPTLKYGTAAAMSQEDIKPLKK